MNRGRRGFAEWVVALVALLLAVTSCGPGAPQQLPGATEQGVTAEATVTSSPTATATATPSATPRPTPTPIDVQAVGWEGISIRTLCVKEELSFPDPGTQADISQCVRTAAKGLGFELVSEDGFCDATLTVSITGLALGATYLPAGFCFSGVELEGEISLSAEGQEPVVLPVTTRYDPPETIRDCPEERSGAPFQEVWPEALLSALAELWGPPALVQVLGVTPGTASVLLVRLGPDAVPALIGGLFDDEEDVRYSSARALGRMGSGATDAVPYLSEALRDDSSWVRRDSAEALGKIGPAAMEAVPALVEVLASEQESMDVKAYLVEALTAITGERLGYNAVLWRQWWESQE